ncbi:phage tail protein [Tateyamaria sp. SN3-11]|uniref:phage tail protein n=1 Tax=Tateyamaria sp. SN3-11 TaxID=3092147 RepID=UPI0039ED8FC8
MRLSFSTLLKSGAAALAMTVGLTVAPQKAEAQTEPFLGQIMFFGGNFCPRGWSATNGQLLAISQYSALFSILGTMYGGDGRTTFGLPETRGRAMVGVGTGPGLSPVGYGQRYGAEDAQITNPQSIPSHSHALRAVGREGTKPGPGSDYLAESSDPDIVKIYHDGPPNRTMDPGSIEPFGSSVPFPVMTPRIGIQTCIALQGVYPSRN